MFYKISYRILICIAVILPTSIHFYAFDDAVSFEYYGTAAIANLCVILFIHLLNRSPLGTSIQIISLIGLGVNFIGWGMYEGGYKPEFYITAMLALFALEFLRLVIRTESDRIHDLRKDDRMLFSIPSHDNFSHPTNRSRQK
jgi:hypothetical protein